MDNVVLQPQRARGAATRVDYVLVGGGLANALVALALVQGRPGARIALVESAPRLGGNHTWSFHGTDLDAAGAALVAPLVTADMPGYDVRFPDGDQTFGRRYRAILSDHLDFVVRNALEKAGAIVRMGVEALTVGRHSVLLASGETLEGTLVIDGRGPGAETAAGAGFQKFLGLEVELDGALPRPVLMDATVPQKDGFRFVYLLDLGAGRVLAEETYFSDGPALDRPALRASLQQYLAQRGLPVRRVVRQEAGVLPMPWTAMVPAPGPGALEIGYRGGWFHPATGYSLPVAVRVALTIASAAPGPELEDALATLRSELAPQLRFFQLLNRLLFAVAPDERWRVYARFFRLPLETQERFFALRTTPRDRLRLLCGSPPRGLRIGPALFPEVRQ